MCGSYQKYIKTIVIKVKTFKTFAMSRSVSFFFMLRILQYRRSSYLANQNKNLQVALLQTQYGNKVSTHFPTCTPLPVSYI